jgi:Flp pilus assembly protein TadB
MGDDTWASTEQKRVCESARQRGVKRSRAVYAGSLVALTVLLAIVHPPAAVIGFVMLIVALFPPSA